MKTLSNQHAIEGGRWMFVKKTPGKIERLLDARLTTGSLMGG
jgi:hypothetical protein